MIDGISTISTTKQIMIDGISTISTTKQIMIDGISTISTLKHKKANNRNINIFNICFQILMNVGQLAHVINFVQTRQAVIHVLAELDSQWMPAKNVKVKIHYIFCFPISKNGRLKMVWHRIRIMCSIKTTYLPYYH